MCAGLTTNHIYYARKIMIEVGQQVIGVVSQLDADLLEEQERILEGMLASNPNLPEEVLGAIEGVTNFLALLLDAIEADA